MEFFAVGSCTVNWILCKCMRGIKMYSSAGLAGLVLFASQIAGALCAEINVARWHARSMTVGESKNSISQPVCMMNSCVSVPFERI